MTEVTGKDHWISRSTGILSGLLALQLILIAFLLVTLHRTTDLCSAAHRGDVPATIELILRGHDPDGQCSDYRTPKFIAIERLHPDVLKVLLNAGVDSEGLTFFAVTFDNLEACAMLLEHGEDIEMKGWKGMTIYLDAVLRNNARMEEFLLSRGADFNARDDEGRTALHISTMQGHAEMVRILLQRGADPSAVNNDNQTPIELVRQAAKKDPAVAEYYAEVISILEEAMAE